MFSKGFYCGNFKMSKRTREGEVIPPPEPAPSAPAGPGPEAGRVAHGFPGAVPVPIAPSEGGRKRRRTMKKRKAHRRKTHHRRR